MLTIYGRKTSVNVQAVMWLVGEIGLEHRRVDVGGAFGGNDSAEFLAKNPNGLVPVLEDGALTMFESNAILRYLADVYGDDMLWPPDPAARAKVDQWMEWSKTSVYRHLIGSVFRALIWTRAADRDLAGLARDVDAANRLMAIADRQIGKRIGLAGDRLTLADFSFGVQLYRYFTLDCERPDLPNLQRYYAALAGRPAYGEHVMVSYDSLRAE